MFRKRQRSPSIGGHERTRKRRKSTLISSAKSAVKILLPVLQEACETFPYLHPVASFIEYMLNHIESLEENREDLEILIRRIRKVLDLLAGPSLVPNSERHVEALKAELQEINATLIPIQKRSMISGFFKATDDAKVIKLYIPRLERALLDYQLAMTHELYKLNIEQISNDELLILNSIDRAKDAGFEAMNNPSVCLEGTRVELLRSLQQWAADWDVLQLHWLNGHAGGGKSTIARSFARLLFSNGDLGASFFCSRDSQHRSDVKMVFPTIAFQLARSRNDASPEFRAAIVRTLKANPDVASLSLQQQLQELILEPVTKSGMKTVIIIDALDECKDEETVSTILFLLARTVKNAPTIKVFITSRPEYHIRSKFHFPELRGITETTTLHVEGATSVNADIRLYLHTSLAEIADDRNQLPGYESLEDWPNQSDVDLLTAKAAGLFIFASTVIRFIASPYHDPRDQLKKIITDLRDFRHEGQQGLDALYLGVLRRAVPPWDDSEFLERLRSILGLLVVGYDIFTPVAIAELFEFPRHTNVWDSLNSLRSVLLVPDNANEPIRFHHKSFPDFLTSSSRCSNLGFWIDCDHHHFKISVACLRQMQRKLKRNVCDLQRYTINDAVNESLIEQCINEATRYSCRFWASHLLCDSRLAERFSDIKPFITHLLTKQQLQWVEALGLLQELRHAVHSLSDLRDWFTKHHDQHQDLLEWVLDGHRFILQSFDVISHSVAQIYHSALPFAPRKSLLRQQHAESLIYEVQVGIGTEEHWHGPIRTIHTQEAVTTLEYSRDGNILAVCLKSSVDIYLSATGELLFEFKLVSSEHIRSITFSADERILAAVSGKGITLWDIATGSVMTEIFAGNLATAIFHPLSEHANLLVSADNVGRITLWNSDTKSCQQISGVEKSLGQLCWLGTMKAIVVGCEYGRAEVWNVDPGLPRRENVFELPSEPGTTTGRSKITALASSEDGLLVALGSEKGALGLYDANTSILLRYIPRATALDGARISSSRFASIIYGSSPRIVISSIRDTIVRVLDLAGNHDPHVVSFEGHSRGVGCATFSPGGRLVASGSVDHTVRIWDAASQHSDHFGTTQLSSASKYNRHSKKITSICFSLDGRLVASGSADCTVMIWDTDNCTLRATLRGIHPQPIWQAIILAGNLHVAAFTDQGNVVVWDLSRGQQLIQKSVFGAGDDLTSSLILPYSHNAEGFFYCPTVFTPETGLTTRQIDCWTIIYDTHGRLRLVLAAQGVIPYQELVVRIRHTSRTSEDNDLYLTLHIICRSGKRLSAIWTRATTIPRSPQQLVFLEEPRDSILDADDPLVCAAGVFPYIPAAHLGISSWHGRKLALGADSGRFTLMDFSRVEDTQNTSW